MSHGLAAVSPDGARLSRRGASRSSTSSSASTTSATSRRGTASRCSPSCSKKHGGIRLAPEKKQALAQIFSTILWGELAAWSISADLALQLEDTEAKMAATSQVFDEARHFYIMRDYLLALDCEIPPLDGYTHAVLTELLDTHRLVDKLLGMQLIVESRGGDAVHDRSRRRASSRCCRS